MKPHYFDQAQADIDDIHLRMCIAQGYVPSTCLLGGVLVWNLMNEGKNPCDGCKGPREKCKGKSIRISQTGR
jgi:hypothetical protein